MFVVMSLVPVAHAFTHPGIPLTAADLDFVKANLIIEPWKSAYASLAADSHSQLTYTMQGPFAVVGRTPDVNLSQYTNDMQAVYNLALMGYFTGNTAYSAKATAIIDAWATTQTSFSGAEPYLTEGDYVNRSVTGADILRGTYSGWTSTNTTNCKNYFANVYEVKVPNPLRSANQGANQLRTAFAIAVFCDNTTLFNQCLAAWRSDACGGITNSLSNGEIGDTGRDQGHAYAQLFGLAWTAEIAWKQGVDLFAENGNRLQAAGEYFSKFNVGAGVPWINGGTCYGLYFAVGGTADYRPASADALSIINNAYAVRKGVATPYTVQLRNLLTENMNSFMYRRTADTSTAVAQPNLPHPTAFTVASLTNVDVGTCAIVGTGTVSSGTWTLRGSGSNIYNTSVDSFHFAYKAVTGDCVILAKITAQGTQSNAKAGLLIRASLAANASDIKIFQNNNPGDIRSTWRGATATDNNVSVQTNAGAVMPYWLKIERLGNRFTTYYSPDGTNWTGQLSAEIPLAATVYAGLGACDGNNTILNTATFTNVSVGASIPVSTYSLKNRATGKMLDNVGQTTDGAIVAQYTDSTSASQQWALSYSNSYAMLTCVTGGKCLDSVGHTVDGSTVGQWGAGSSMNQRWIVQDLGTTYFKIINAANGKCLDTGGGTTDGSQMQFWSSGTSLNQQWQFVAP